MAKLVTKFKYIKPGSGKNVGNYAAYIAKRPGVEKIDDQPDYIKEVFVKSTEEHPLGLLNTDFIYK